MNEKDKKLFEACKDVANKLGIPQTSWLCSLVEELEAEVGKAKGQRDRLREVLISLLDDTRDPVFDKAKKVLAELEKKT